MGSDQPLRATGDAILAILSGGIVNVILDPIFIFGFYVGVKGAVATFVIVHISIFIISIYGMVYHHG